MKISKRLETISEFIDDNCNIIDVGCDHALLDIYLFKNKKNIKLIASDIGVGPLEQAKKNIEKYNCDIKVKLGNGLDSIEKDIDTVIITGMGGDTIVDIFKRGISSISNVKTIVLSPQSEWMKVRSYINSLGFYIVDEKIIKDGKYYLIMKFVKGKKKYSLYELEFGPVLLKNRTEAFIDYYTYLLKEELNIKRKMPLCKFKDRYIQNKKIRRIKKCLK